jgi:hypothetical protein
VRVGEQNGAELINSLPLMMVNVGSYGMLRCVALVRTDVSEDNSTSFIKVTKIGKQGTTLAVTSNRRTLRRSFMMMEAL